MWTDFRSIITGKIFYEQNVYLNSFDIENLWFNTYLFHIVIVNSIPTK